MQFTSAIIAVITIFGVSAAPAAWAGDNNPPSGSGGSSSCPASSTAYCCQTGAFLGLTCVLSSALGQSCNQQTICCVNSGSGSQSCSNTDGSGISVPITIGITL